MNSSKRVYEKESYVTSNQESFLLLQQIHGMKKRLKTINENNKLIVESSAATTGFNPNNTESLEISKKSQTYPDKNNVDTIHTIDASNSRNYLELLPNELLFSIGSYLKITDLLQSFYGLNERFNSIVCRIITNLYVPNDISLTWLRQYLPNFADSICKLSCTVNLLPHIFPYEGFYPNLTYMILKQPRVFNVEFNVTSNVAFETAITCLNVLTQCDLQTTYNTYSRFDDNDATLKKDHQRYSLINTSSSLKIVRLDIDFFSEKNLLYLCAIMPNLKFLRIKELQPSTNLSLNYDIFDVITQYGSLTELQLHIRITNDMQPELIARLIGCFKSSLEKLILVIQSSNLFMDGRRLQETLEPCQRLNEFTFAFETKHDMNINMMDVWHQFQSQWWLSTRRAPVLFLRKSTDHMFIGSMPCNYMIDTTYPTNLALWRLNKESLDSSMVRFTKLKAVCFESTVEQRITFDLISFIDRVFSSRYQQLTMRSWQFRDAQTLLAQVTAGTIRLPKLNKVTSLILDSINQHRLDAASLILWLLVTPNIKQLDLKPNTSTERSAFIKELNQLISTDNRLSSLLDGTAIIRTWKSRQKTQGSSKRSFFNASTVFSNSIR